MLGRGSFGVVRLVQEKLGHDEQPTRPRQVFAMKVLKKKHLIKTNSVDNTMAEKDILRKVFIPSFIYYFLYFIIFYIINVFSVN